MSASPSRADMLKRAMDLYTEIGLHFSSVRHWNDVVKTQDETPIDPDPDGRLTKIYESLARTLRVEGVGVAMDGAKDTGL